MYCMCMYVYNCIYTLCHTRVLCTCVVGGGVCLIAYQVSLPCVALGSMALGLGVSSSLVQLFKNMFGANGGC